MSASAAAIGFAPDLRVAILAEDPARRARLASILTDAGHRIADSPRAADVVLCDGDCPPVEDRPCVALGAADPDHAGALPRDADASQIDAALRAVAVGLIVRSADPGPGFSAVNEGSLPTLLTPREIEILGAMAQGQTNKLIARRLNISLHTVKFHVESLFRKLGVRSRAAAVARASEWRSNRTIDL